MLGGALQLQRRGLPPVRAWWADDGHLIDDHEWPGTRALVDRVVVAPRLMRVVTQADEVRHVSCGAAPLTGPDGASLGAVITAVDLSAEVALQHRLGDAEARLRSLSLNQSAQHERQMGRVARDLHDNLGQVLSLLKLHLNSAARSDAAPQRRELELAEAMPLVDLALQRLREVCNDLLPSELADFGLLPALQSLCGAARQASGLTVRADSTGTSRPLQQALQLALFRVAQQALTNALRHAAAQVIEVTLAWQPDRVSLIVCDDGAGFDPQAAPAPKQQGLRGMRERMELLGGTLQIESNPGSGSVVRASLPTAAAPLKLPDA